MVTKARFQEIIAEFKNKHIAVIGDMMLDEYIIGKVDRISPEAPVPIVNVESENFVLGGAANVLNNLSALGSKVTAFGIIGKDSNGEKLLIELQNKGVLIDGIVEDSSRPTIVKKRILAQHQQLIRLDWEKRKNISQEIESIIIKKFEEKICDFDGIILSDYDKGLLTENVAKEMIRIANKNNKIIIVDPKPSNSKNYIGATSMTPNRKEAIECAGVREPETDEELKAMGTKLKEQLQLQNLLMTRSEKGMSLFQDGSVTDIPTFAKDVFDVTGAGDTVIAVYTLSAACGASYYEAAKIANTAAGIVVGRVGTATTTKEEIIKFYEEIYK